MKLFEKTHFNGNVHNATYLLSYGTINGDIDMVPEVGKTNGNYYISFGEHTGTVRGNDESLLVLIPNGITLKGAVTLSNYLYMKII